MNANDDDTDDDQFYYSPHDERRDQSQQQEQSSQNPSSNSVSNNNNTLTTTSTAAAAPTKSAKKPTTCSPGFKYKAMIAPVKVINCPTIKFGKQYFCRVTRLKDRIEYATPIVKCEMPGTLDFTKLRRSDNRGPQRPPFVTPLSLHFETIKDKRTVTIYVEEYCELYRHNGTCTRLAPGAIPPVAGDPDEDDENRKIVAIAHFDLIGFVNVFENETKGLTNFPIEVRPTESASEDVTLKMMGARSVIEVDMLMHPSRLVEPMWPSPNEREQNFHKLLARSALFSNNDSQQQQLPTLDHNNNSNNNKNNNSAHSSFRAMKQRSASAKRRLAIAEHAIFRAQIKKGDESKGAEVGDDDDDEAGAGDEDGGEEEEKAGGAAASSKQMKNKVNVSSAKCVNGANFAFASGANPLGDAQNKKRQKHSVLTPEMQKQIQNALDALNQIQNLRNTVIELENEVIELEERRNVMMAMNSSSSREDSRSGNNFQSQNHNCQTNSSGSNQTTPSPALHHNNNNFQESPSLIFSQQEYARMEDFIASLQQDVQMMIGDALTRWDSSSLGFDHASSNQTLALPSTDFSEHSPPQNMVMSSPSLGDEHPLKDEENSKMRQELNTSEIFRLLSSENFVPAIPNNNNNPSNRGMVPPNAALEKFVVMMSINNNKNGNKNNTCRKNGPMISAKELFIDGEDGVHDESKSRHDDGFSLRNEFLINEATQMCIATIEKYLQSVVETKGEIFPNFSLPNEEEIVKELLKKI